MALPDVALLPFPWPINQLKCLRPSWFIFAPASHLIPRLRLLLPRCLLTESGAAAVAGAGASICLKYLTGTCAQQFQLPFVVVWPLPAFYSFCICVCVCVFSVYIYIVFFVLLLNSQVAFEAEFPLLRCLLPLSLCLFLLFSSQNESKKVSLSISRIMHNNNTEKWKKNRTALELNLNFRGLRGCFAAVTATTICGKWLPQAFCGSQIAQSSRGCHGLAKMCCCFCCLSAFVFATLPRVVVRHLV